MALHFLIQRQAQGQKTLGKDDRDNSAFPSFHLSRVLTTRQNVCACGDGGDDVSQHPLQQRGPRQHGHREPKRELTSSPVGPFVTHTESWQVPDLLIALPSDGGGDRRLLMAGLPDCLVGSKREQVSGTTEEKYGAPDGTLNSTFPPSIQFY